ncbi:MAG: hypothetical protein R2769_17085 [Saprospiraceae bacterium]
MLTISLAGNLLLILLCILFVFHLLILAGFIPHDIIWAGKIRSKKHLIQMESISILVTIIMAIIVCLKMDYLNWIENKTIIKIAMWILFAFFTLNTLGNLTAKTKFEKYAFGTLTLFMALLALYLALN